MNTSLKQRAAEEAVSRFVRDGMVLGLGTGSTVYFALRKLGEELKSGRLRDLVGVPTSVHTEKLALKFGIPLTSLGNHKHLDVTIDGADEVDDALCLIKGLGGALLREKIVAVSSRKVVIVVDESKHVNRLGVRAPLPVEVAQFAWQVHLPFLRSLGARPRLRMATKDQPYLTDNGNFILDAHFRGGIPDVRTVAEALDHRPGVVCHGLFLGLADAAIVAGGDGIRVLTRASGG
jgi:ribose 5-phosphate isomerase A